MTTATDLMDRVLHLTTLLAEDLARFEHEHGLSTSRLHLLWQLGADGPATQRALATALSVSPRNVTGLVDGLVDSGHVTRQPHPRDRRATLVTLTRHGEDFVDSLQQGRRQLAGQLFGDLAEDERDRYAKLLDSTIGRLVELVAQP